MPTALPLATAHTDAATTEAQLKTAITNQRAALAEMGDPMGMHGALQNLSLAFSVGANALTANVKTRAGATASATDPISAALRNATLATGDFNVRNITGALSLVISSGSTLGHFSGLAARIYWYLIDNAGTLELAASTKFFGPNGIVSTTAEGGAGAADSATVMYSTTARANVPFVCIGRTIDTQTVAGTWAAVPSSVELAPFMIDDFTTSGISVNGLAANADVQTFTANGTWTKPANAKTVVVIAFGPGGGGGGGTGGAAASARNGGYGGGGGSTKTAVFNAASLGSTVTVTVPSGGTGGAGGISGSGTDGGAGTACSFGAHLTAYGGGPGSGASQFGVFSGGSGAGTASNGLPGSSGVSIKGGDPYPFAVGSAGIGGAGGGGVVQAAGQPAEYGGGAGGANPNAGGAGTNGGSSIFGAGGGGAGGGVTSGNVETVGGVGGGVGTWTTGGGGTSGAVNGGAGGAGPDGTGILMGSGGGGGGGQDSGTGGAGGNGGIPGGGGGGGGGGTTTGGAGGNGGRGEVRVYTFF